MTQGSVLVVGAGINGLMSAYELRKQGFDVQVVDAMEDPRYPSRSQWRGATFSGFDARHISITETGPWTSPSRIQLIDAPSSERGWRAISPDQMWSTEREWQRAFIAQAQNPKLHVQKTANVYRRNHEGMEGWLRLAVELPEIFSPINDNNELLIVCGSQNDWQEEFSAEKELDHRHVHPVDSPSERYGSIASRVESFQAKSFAVAGGAYRVKTLAIDLISFLEKEGVIFNWNREVAPSMRELRESGASSAYKGDINEQVRRLFKQKDVVVWCGGASNGLDRVSRTPVPQGVLGCWIDIPNPGVELPLKILDANPEPVNFLNVTPSNDRLIISGGYAWVGSRSLDEVKGNAEILKQVNATMRVFVGQVKDWFNLPEKLEANQYPTAMCIRPSYPDGESRCEWADTHFGPMVINRGHAAGGFTQAPAMAKLVVETVNRGAENIPSLT